MATEREVGGIRCHEVLEILSEYVDGDLAADRRALIEAHLVGCDWCERFGGHYTSMVTDLRRQLAAPRQVDADVQQRLFARLGLASSNESDSDDST